MRTAVIIGLLLAQPASAADPASPAAKTFTLRKSAARLGDVLDELGRQTGIEVERDRLEPDRTLSLDCDKLGFWAALERIARDSDHRIAFVEQGRGVALVAEGGYKQTPTAFDGPYRVSARRVTATLDLDTDRQSTEIALDVNWLPGTRVFLLDVASGGVTATDNTDKELSVAESGGRVGVPGGGVTVPVRLTDVPRGARAIKTLEGVVGVVGAAKMLEVEFADLVKAKDTTKQTVNGVNVEIRTDFKPNADLWSVRVELTYPEGGPVLESFESSAWLVDNDVYLLSQDGKRRLSCNGGYELIGGSERQAAIIYRFAEEDDLKLGKAEDWKLTVRTPDVLTETKVRFKLENIPLP